MTDKSDTANGEKPKQISGGLKFLIELGPIVAFFVAYKVWGLMPATGVIMVAMVIALAANWIIARHIPKAPIVTAVIVLVFGGLTLWLNDETFIKMKPTIINGLFALVLFGGLVFGKALLKPLLEMAMALTDEGWKGLSFRWGIFFLAMAVLNEAIWRTQTTDFWVNFKTFALIPLTLVFALSQLPYMQRHQIETPGEDEAS